MEKIRNRNRQDTQGNKVSSFLHHSHIDSFTRVLNASFFIYHRLFYLKRNFNSFRKSLAKFNLDRARHGERSRADGVAHVRCLLSSMAGRLRQRVLLLHPLLRLEIMSTTNSLQPTRARREPWISIYQPLDTAVEGALWGDRVPPKTVPVDGLYWFYAHNDLKFTVRS